MENGCADAQYASLPFAFSACKNVGKKLRSVDDIITMRSMTTRMMTYSVVVAPFRIECLIRINYLKDWQLGTSSSSEHLLTLQA
jgi:hypothetical protein